MISKTVYKQKGCLKRQPFILKFSVYFLTNRFVNAIDPETNRIKYTPVAN